MKQGNKSDSNSDNTKSVRFKYFAVVCLISLIFLLVSSNSSADWVNLTGAESARNIVEIYVNNDHVKIKFEIFIEDFILFEELIPDDFFPVPIPERPGIEARSRFFSEQIFQVITDTGTKLSAKFDVVEPRIRVERPSSFAGMINPFTRQRIPGPPDDKRVLYAEVTYPFQGKPQYLSFIPPLHEKGSGAASIGFICYHQGVPVVDFRHLPSRSTLHLHWDDPWYSAFEKKQLKRNLQTGVRTYLYIEPFEVRHEILVRVRDMMNWMVFDLRGDEYIDEDEFNSVREQVAKFFLERENVVIDGQRLKPILDKTAYVESTMIRSRFIEIPEKIPLNSAMIGIVITYLTDGIPGEVETSWDLFSDKVQRVTGIMVDPAGPFPYDLEPGDNVLKWTNYLTSYSIPTVKQITADEKHKGLRLPIGSLGCILLVLIPAYSIVQRLGTKKPKMMQILILAGLLVGSVFAYPFFTVSIGNSARASKINDSETSQIVLGLLKNIYRAFEFREEDDVYDKLSVSVAGELLTEIYLQSRKSLIIEQAGGAQAKVEELEVLKAQMQESFKHQGAVDVRAQWTAVGSVGHWGHIHTRHNVYDAIMTLIIDDDHWKISDLEVLEERRIDPYAGLRRQAAL